MATTRSPWLLPFALLGGLLVAGILFVRAYGSLDAFEVGAGSLAVALLLAWGFLRQSQHGPIPLPGASRVREEATGAPFAERLHSSYRWAFGSAAMYSVYVLVLTGLQGSTWFAKPAMSTWSIILGYWLIAIVAGFGYALLLPLARWRFGAFLVGTSVGYLVYGSVALLLPGNDAGPWWLPLIPGTIVGGGLALVFYDAP